MTELKQTIADSGPVVTLEEKHAKLVKDKIAATGNPVHDPQLQALKEELAS